MARVEPDAETTAHLLASARSGSREAIERLAARYREPLVRWASGRLPAHARGLCDTQDLVHDALAAALARLDKLEAPRPGAFHAYLRRSVLDRLRDQLRRSEVRERISEHGYDRPAEATSPLERAIGADALARYERALERLEPAEREIIVARLELDRS